MSKNKAMVLVAVLVAVVVMVVVFILVFRDGANIHVSLPFGAKVSLEGEGASPPGPGRIEGEGLKAGRDLTAGN